MCKTRYVLISWSVLVHSSPVILNFKDSSKTMRNSKYIIQKKFKV